LIGWTYDNNDIVYQDKEKIIARFTFEIFVRLGRNTMLINTNVKNKQTQFN